jgi:hypothetical protein
MLIKTMIVAGHEARCHVVTGWQDYARSAFSDVTLSSWASEAAFASGSPPLAATTVRIQTADIRAQFVKNMGNPNTFDDEVEEAVRLYAPEFESAVWVETVATSAETRAERVAQIKRAYAEQIESAYSAELRAWAQSTINAARTADGNVAPEDLQEANRIADAVAALNAEMMREILKA